MEWLVVVLVIIGGTTYTFAQSCTQKVLVEEGTGGSKKVTMVRRIPAKCSNWDKAWVWITGMDCGTKYVLETVNFPSKTQVYRTQKICCPGETNCKNTATEPHTAGGLDENDEKFLAITFGSATAALVIILLLIIVSFCRKNQPRCIENFFNRRERMYEEDFIGVEPSAPYLDGQSNYKHGSLRLIESEYEEIPEYHAKDKYPIVESISDGNRYIQEFEPSDGPRHNNQNDYTRDVLISLASKSNEGETNEKIQSGEGISCSESNSGSYENEVVRMLQPIQESSVKVSGSLSQNANDEMQLLSGDFSCGNNNARNDIQNNVEHCTSNDTDENNSPSKCSVNSNPNDYIDFSNIVVPNGDQHSVPTAKVHSYEKLDVSTREKNNSEQMYDALQLSVNDRHNGNS